MNSTDSHQTKAKGGGEELPSGARTALPPELALLVVDGVGFLCRPPFGRPLLLSNRIEKKNKKKNKKQ